jgi:hypothetical protein
MKSNYDKGGASGRSSSSNSSTNSNDNSGGNNIWKITIIIISLIILLHIYNTRLAHPRNGACMFEELRSKFKTGDLLLFHALDNINTIFMGCYYGHVGVVFRDPACGELYIFEAFNTRTSHFHSSRFRRGIALCKLEHRINTYPGYVYYKELKYELPIELQFSFIDFINYATHNMYYDSFVARSALKKILFNFPLTQGTNCGELAYLSLIKLGLLPIENFKKNNKHHLKYISELTKLPRNQNKYKLPIQILKNYFI